MLADRNHRDFVIEHLAADEAAVVEVAAAYREAYLVALAELADRDRLLAAATRTIASLRDELRRYTQGVAA